MQSLAEHVRSIVPLGVSGRISRIVGTTATVAGFPVAMGSVCRVTREHAVPLTAEVIGFQGSETLIAAYGDWSGVRWGDRVELISTVPKVRAGNGLLGRVIDGQGQFLDGRPAPILPHRIPLHHPPTSALQRPRIDRPLATGVRVLDALLTCGQGQRLGIFSGSGVGKSTLLGQIARSSTADVNVIVLVGERGREVREFIERDLGPEGLAKSVVVVATGDEAAILRLRAAHLGTAVAEYFRDAGKNVLLIMDSVTRCALAQREIGLSAGEPATTRGYPPSVFSFLPRLLERSGRTASGSITAFYSVLVEGDDPHEPITDAVRGILDGHVVLSRKLAERGHFPALDVLASLSRLFPSLTSPEQQSAALRLRQVLAAYAQAEDLINLGAYIPGANPQVDAYLRCQPEIEAFLQQQQSTELAWDESKAALQRLVGKLK